MGKLFLGMILGAMIAATDKGNGECLLKTCHEVEAQGVERPVLYAEYLTYWFPKNS